MNKTGQPHLTAQP